MFKKAFTLAEILICIMIIGLLALVLLRTLNPKRFDEKTNLANARKTIEVVSNGFVQMLDLEQAQCPTKSFMVKPAGLTSYEFTVLNSSGSAADSNAIVSLLGNYLKYEKGPLNFCDNTSYCSNSNIKGAKLVGGVFYGIEKFSSISDCPAYRLPGETADTAAPTKFLPKSGTYEKVKCWGKLYIDVNGTSGENKIGSDVYVLGLGENGIVR